MQTTETDSRRNTDLSGPITRKDTELVIYKWPTKKSPGTGSSTGDSNKHLKKN